MILEQPVMRVLIDLVAPLNTFSSSCLFIEYMTYSHQNPTLKKKCPIDIPYYHSKNHPIVSLPQLARKPI